jgi:hypothetical protein|eukprot:Tamp_18805.p1 GENE.Tamp_18805~~Tamp_18805.p1  ORF type:complete len:282 (+),score=41.24 Tamp_18805:83-847(+)
MRDEDRAEPAGEQLQRLCEKSEAWDEALLVSEHRAAHTRTRAKLSAILSGIEAASYTDYIGRSLHVAAGPGDHVGTMSRPIAIPAAQARGRRDDADEPQFFPLDGHSDYSCSVDDLYAARNMWVPPTTPPNVDEDRYIWAVDLLEGAMAMAERERAHDTSSEAHPYAAVPGSRVPRHSATCSTSPQAGTHPTKSAGDTSDVRTGEKLAVGALRVAAGKTQVRNIAFSCPLDGWSLPHQGIEASSVQSPAGPAEV